MIEKQNLKLAINDADSSAHQTRWSNPAQLQQSFTVPFLHLVWFCDGAFEDACAHDELILSQTLQTDGLKTLVQIWIDDAVDDSNPNFANALKDCIRAIPHLELARPVEKIVGGESCKNDPAHVQRILAAINEDNLDRRSYLIVIGGGAVLDVVGYAAAIAHRGIRLVRFPSTTLAQGDSGVGVKNAVNAFGKKNWQGTFAVPWTVINDYALLRSLPNETFVSGFSEAVKVTLLKSAESFAFICDNADAIARRDESICQQVIEQSAKLHLNHITEGGDPFEVLEARPLDFGHWSAHKLETISGYSIRHGDAVAIGLAIDVLYSVDQLGLDRGAAQKILACLVRLGLPITHSLLESHAEEILSGLEEFRQHLGGRLTVTMLSGIGEPTNVNQIDHAVMSQSLKRLAQAGLAGKPLDVESLLHPRK